MAPFDFSKKVIQFSDSSSKTALTGLRDLLANSLAWSAEQLQNVAQTPLVNQSEWSTSLLQSSQNLKSASETTRQGLQNAIQATSAAFQGSLEFLEMTEKHTHIALFENVHVSSIVGESFADLVQTSQIKPSFRRPPNKDELFGADISVAQQVEAFKQSKLKRAVLCIPGLLCDENLWSGKTQKIPKLKPVPNSDAPETGGPDIPLVSVTKSLAELKIYPMFLRFNPGNHISDNGKALLQLIQEMLAELERQSCNLKELDVISYSQGGLILRSALYQSRQADQTLSKHLGRVVMISSPDGGSWLEKMGFWLGLGLERLPLPVVNTIGFIGNQRSDAIKDLSHGIIREEDWRAEEDLVTNHKKRYGQELYFGELDDIDAWQLYSLVFDQQNVLKSWLGDGIVEEPSLSFLSKKVFLKKSNPGNRVHCLHGLDHFAIIHAPETQAILKEILR